MEVLALYLLKVHITISLLYAVYYLTVKNELFFSLNRFILLGIILLSFSLPLLPSLRMDQVDQIGAVRILSTLNNASAIVSEDNPLRGKEISRLADEWQLKRLSGLIISLLSVYLCVSAFRLHEFFSQISNVRSVIKSSDRVFDYNITFRNSGDEIAAFSFFKSIVVNRDFYDEEELRQIIAHEKAHVNQWHSIDILLAELTSVFLWGNPFAKALKNTIRLNLEFLADKEVLDRGFDKKEYQWSILMPYLEHNAYPLTNLYSSTPKQRIEKMNAKRSSALNLYKYAFIIPVIAFIYFGIAPFRAAALDKIYTMHLIDKHEFRDYLGYYEFERDKGSYVHILMKDEKLVMKTLWNNKKIYFRKHSKNGFIDQDFTMPLAFPRSRNGRIEDLVAFGDDRWEKVQEYKPVKKKRSEGLVISRTSSGGMQVLVYAVEPWANVKHYEIKNAVDSP